MNGKQIKYSVFIVGIIGLTGAYLYWRRKVKKEGDALLEYINNSLSQVDLSQATEQGIGQVRDLKYDKNKVKIDNLSGSYNNKIRDALVDVSNKLYYAMKGPGTDLTAVGNNLMRIKNKNTLGFLNTLYKALHKEDLFDAMKGEVLLNSAGYGLYSDKTKYNLVIPGLSEAYWHPKLAAYFNSLPIY